MTATIVYAALSTATTYFGAQRLKPVDSEWSHPLAVAAPIIMGLGAYGISVLAGAALSPYIVAIATLGQIALGLWVLSAFDMKGETSPLPQRVDVQDEHTGAEQVDRGSTLEQQHVEASGILPLPQRVDVQDEQQQPVVAPGILSGSEFENKLSKEVLGRLQAAITEKKSDTYRGVMVPIHQIFEGLALGNDVYRESVNKSVSRSIPPGDLKNAVSVFDMSELTESATRNTAALSTTDGDLGFDVLISFNSMGRAGDGRQPFPKVGRDGLQHFRYPVVEGTKDEYIKVLQETGAVEGVCESLSEIFSAVDQALNAGEKVLFHCNQGEHRSATFLVLYLVSRAGCSFEEAHAFVSAKRGIKPLKKTGERDTLMTVAYELMNSAS